MANESIHAALASTIETLEVTIFNNKTSAAVTKTAEVDVLSDNNASSDLSHNRARKAQLDSLV